MENGGHRTNPLTTSVSRFIRSISTVGVPIACLRLGYAGAVVDTGEMAFGTVQHFDWACRTEQSHMVPPAHCVNIIQYCNP